MPFQSAKQRRYMWSQHPEIAKRWSNKYGSATESNKPEPDPEKRKQAVARRLTRG